MKNQLIIITTILALYAGQTIKAQNKPAATTLPSGAGPGQISYPTDFNQSPNVAPVLQNYVREYIPLSPYNSLPSFGSSSTAPIQISTTYTNGWGNPVMSVLRNNTAKDIIQPFDIRTSDTQVSYLPYPETYNSTFYNNVYTRQKNYYNGAFPAENATAYSASKTYSDSGVPSGVWYLPGRVFVGDGRGEQEQGGMNNANEIYKVGIISGLPAYNGFYGAGELSMTVSQGQHGQLAKAYMDKSGRLICQKQLADTAWLSTYYVYDEMGRLAFIVPPKASSQFYYTTGISSYYEKELLFRYDYDKYGKRIGTQLPGKSDTEIVVYDNLHRPILFRTPNMKDSSLWSFVVYDGLNRATFSGLYKGSESTGYWRGVGDGTVSPVTRYVGMTPVNADSTLEYYIINGFSGTSYPSGLYGCTINTYNYYDDYTSLPDTSVSFATLPSGSYLPASGSIITPVPYMHTLGQLVGTKVRIKSEGVSNNFTNQWITNVYFYDEQGRLIQQQTKNPWNNWDTVSMQYNFSGQKVYDISSYNFWSSANKSKFRIAREYEYHTRSGQLLKVSQKIDTFAWQVISNYAYDDMGRVKTKWLGNIEEQNYTYNMRGQLTGINSSSINPATLPSTMTYASELNYETGFDSARYDGLLTGYKWRSASSEKRAYGYRYDNAARMVHADYNDSSNAIPATPTNPLSWNKANRDFTVSNLSYDRNGNIQTMNQRGYDSLFAPITMDQLSYTYDAGNKLMKITDAGSKSPLADFDNGSSGTSDDYTYDADGNLASDANKGISILYNEADKPVWVANASDSIHNIYDAMGNLRQKRIIENSDTTTRTFWGAFVFKNDTLEFIKHEEGRARWDDGDGYYKYDFFVCDHQGNVRTVVTEDVIVGHIIGHAGFELNAANVEEAIFTQISEVRDLSPSGTPGDVMAGILNGSMTDKKIGASILMHVMTGDQVNMQSYGYYETEDTSVFNTYAAPEDVLSELQTALTGINIIGGEGGTISTYTVNGLLNTTNYAVYDAIKDGITDRNYPRAYLNYLVFDEEMNIDAEQCDVVQLTGAPNTWHLQSLPPKNVKKNGYILFFLSNESSCDVAINNTHIITYQSSLQEEQHYYPHGLVVDDGTRYLNNKNRHLFEGNELQHELGLELSDFNARNYDQQIGRFTAIDLLSDMDQEMLSPYHFVNNDPANSTDPLGLYDPRWSNVPKLHRHTQSSMRSSGGGDSGPSMMYMDWIGVDYGLITGTADFGPGLEGRGMRTTITSSGEGPMIKGSDGQMRPYAIGRALRETEQRIKNGKDAYQTGMNSGRIVIDLNPVFRFKSGFDDGAFEGAKSTINFIGGLTTKKGLQEAVQSTADVLTMSDDQKMLVFWGAIDYMKSIPNKTSYELGFDVGVAVEKTLEIALTRKVSGPGIGIKPVNFGNVKIPVYRVYGGGASMYGKSYTLFNPKYVPFYRKFAGLPNVNTGQYLLKGSIPLRNIKVGRWFAAPLDGNIGGLPLELYQNYDQLTNPANIIIKKGF